MTRDPPNVASSGSGVRKIRVLYFTDNMQFMTDFIKKRRGISSDLEDSSFENRGSEDLHEDPPVPTEVLELQSDARIKSSVPIFKKPKHWPLSALEKVLGFMIAFLSQAQSRIRKIQNLVCVRSLVSDFKKR
jgi:hypothetical protein